MRRKKTGMAGETARDSKLMHRRLVYLYPGVLLHQDERGGLPRVRFQAMP